MKTRISDLRATIARQAAELQACRSEAGTQNLTEQIPLGEGDLEALVHTTREGQEAPSYGDGVKVQAILALPAETEAGYTSPQLLPVLRFGHRCYCGGAGLWPMWGEDLCYTGDLYRGITKHFTAPTWREAFGAARAWGAAEVTKLVTAVAARRRAFLDAEGPATTTP